MQWNYNISSKLHQNRHAKDHISDPGEDRAICEQLRSKLLAIWRKELIVLPAAYELAKGLIKQSIKLLRKKLTKEELTKICGDNKNELRRKGLCFVCKGVSALDH